MKERPELRAGSVDERKARLMELAEGDGLSLTDREAELLATAVPDDGDDERLAGNLAVISSDAWGVKPPKDYYQTVVGFTARTSEARPQLAAWLNLLCDQAKDDPGCFGLIALQSMVDESRFVLLGAWTNEDAADGFLTGGKYQDFTAASDLTPIASISRRKETLQFIEERINSTDYNGTEQFHYILEDWELDDAAKYAAFEERRKARLEAIDTEEGFRWVVISRLSTKRTRKYTTVWSFTSAEMADELLKALDNEASTADEPRAFTYLPYHAEAYRLVDYQTGKGKEAEGE